MTGPTATASRVLFGRFRRSGRAALGRRVQRALEQSDSLQETPDDRLRGLATELAWRAKTGEPLGHLLVEAYALTREAARRAVGKSLYPEQLLAGFAMASGSVAQMQTGEGKTLATLAPAFAHALAGRGCHVVTANDYLAERDARLAAEALGPLGVTVGCVVGETPHAGRRAEYARDITYGTAREFGFDFLRDRLAGSDRDRVQRGRHAALVDEADNVLLDDAVTPLVISLPSEEDAPDGEWFGWCRSVAGGLAPGVDFTQSAESRTLGLTAAGFRRVVGLARPACCREREASELHQGVTDALVAERLFQRDVDYLIDPSGAVAIIDSSTGRVAAERRWREGLQQAIEAKEGLAPTAPTTTAARCTVQAYFRGYHHLAGATGTAESAADELWRVYQLRVEPIPTARPCRRVELPTRLFGALDTMHAAVVDEVKRRQAAGGALLIGTPSVSASERLARLLAEAGAPHEVLNCRAHQREAELVAQAGAPGRVTVATNMAGRGTDIEVDPRVLRRGGLHVMITQTSPNGRIDRQLAGRAARQGDPGSFQRFLSFDDESLAALAEGELAAARRRAGSSGELPAGWVGWFRRAQRRLDRRQQAVRRALLESERSRSRACRRMGIDPLLEALD